MTTEPNVDVRVTRRFDAPAEHVFDAWLDTGTIARWMFGPSVRDDEHVVRLAADGRVGGSFSFAVRRQGQDIDHVGEYLELQRPGRLVFTWATADTLPHKSRVVVEIEPIDAGSDVRLTHTLHPRWAHVATRTQASWQGMLDSLALTLREGAGSQTRVR